jgi:ATP-independent RNA helicase DbpA
MLDNLKSLGYHNLTEIQEKSLSVTLNGGDLIAQAKTGSGKTASFGITLLHKLNVSKFRIQSLVLSPTRELANQVANELQKIARYKHNIKILTLCGGVPYRPQVHSLSHQAHIVVGTPGRILKHLKEGNFQTLDIDSLVLDEADKMLDMGFYDDIKDIISYLPKKRQTMLFSATYPFEIEDLAKDILNKPTKIVVESTHSESIIEQVFYESNYNEKYQNTLRLFDKYKPNLVLIFCNTKLECDELSEKLKKNNLSPLVLHSDLDQKERNETIILFSNKSHPILIATDVASRGIDIDDISLIVNYDFPRTLEVYTHRIGRTARAGKTGKAISFIDIEDMDLFQDLKITYKIEQNLQSSSNLIVDTKYNFTPIYDTLFINGGKKQKIRKGDILGTLIKGVHLDKNDVGQIDILNFCAFVAIKKKVSKKTCDVLNNTKLKGKYFKVYFA